MNIRIVVLPPAPIATMAAQLAKKYADTYPHWFVVDAKRLTPHITLLPLTIKTKDQKNLEPVLRHLVRTFPKLYLVISRHRLYKGGWVSLKIKNSPPLTKLRKELFNQTRIFDIVPHKKLKKLFSPHITLTKFKNDKNATKAIQSSKIPFKVFEARTVALCITDTYGQVTKVIKKFNLKA